MVELVVVMVAITVIALLLILPAIRHPHHHVPLAVCASHLDQMHTAQHVALLDRENHRLPTSAWRNTVVGPRPGPKGYRGDEFGFEAEELNEYGWTYKVGLCPGVTPDTGGERRRDFWYTRKPDGGGLNGSDYLYTGGRADHIGDHPDDPEAVKAALGPPRFGFPYDKPGGIYYSVDEIYSGRKSVDEHGNTYRDETYPNEVIYLSDISYNAAESYPGWYYKPFTDPSNHRDTSLDDAKKGESLWPAIGRGSNRMMADGSVKWWNFPVKDRGNGTEMPGSYMRDYYASYY